MKIFKKQDFPKVWMKWLKIARLQDFAPNTPGLLGAFSCPQTLCREVRDSHCESTNPPLEIPAYGGASCIGSYAPCMYFYTMINCSMGLIKRGTENGVKRFNEAKVRRKNDINEFCWYNSYKGIRFETKQNLDLR